MRVGLQIPYFKYDGGGDQIGSKLAEIARTADDAGFYSMWFMDHFFQIGVMGPVEDPMLEAYTTLGYIAGLTKNIKLGAMVTGVIYRYPALLIKEVTTLDVLSGGRAYLGIGAAWNEEESKGLGVPYPPTGVRFEMLEEALQIAHQMWSDNNGAYSGKYNQLDATLNSPAALTKPHPPILIGGMGEQKTLRLVAQYADATNLFASIGAEIMKQKLDVLRQHCDRLGRNYDDIEKSTLGPVNLAPDKMTAADVIKRCKELADVGIQHAIFNMPNAHDITPLEIFGKEIIPAVADF
jgi:F420-dependent oxidoreductase-like protein